MLYSMKMRGTLMALLIILVVMHVSASQGYAETFYSASAVTHSKSREFIFYHQSGKIEMMVMNDRLIVLSSRVGKFSTLNKLCSIENNRIDLIDSFKGNYMLIGGTCDEIILSKIRSGFLNKLYEGAALYTVNLNGKWKVHQKYREQPYYSYVDGRLLFVANKEKANLEQWNEYQKTFDVVLRDIDIKSIVTHDTLLCTLTPFDEGSDYALWIPSEKRQIELYCGGAENIKDFIYSDGNVYWSDNLGIHRFNSEDNEAETVIAFHGENKGKAHTYFYMNGNDIYYTDNGLLNVYNVERKTHGSFNFQPMDPDRFVVVQNILYSCDASNQIQYVVLSDDLERGVITLD